MPTFSGKTISVPCRAGGRIRKAACRHNTGIPAKLFPTCQLCLYESSVSDTEPYNLCMESDLNMKPLHLLFHGSKHVRGMVGYRKYSLSPFYLRRHPKAFKKLNHILVCISIEAAVQKPWIADYRGKQGLHIACVGNIASPFSCDKEFFS